MSLTLVRQGKEVTCNGVKLTMVEQKTKGAGNEVIKIEGLAGSNGAKWISLSKLQEGENVIHPVAKQVVSTGSYTLTPEEKKQVDALQAQIDAIKAKAKARYVAKPKFLSNVEFAALSPKEQLEYTESMNKYIEALRNGARI